MFGDRGDQTGKAGKAILIVVFVILAILLWTFFGKESTKDASSVVAESSVDSEVKSLNGFADDIPQPESIETPPSNKNVHSTPTINKGAPISKKDEVEDLRQKIKTLADDPSFKAKIPERPELAPENIKKDLPAPLPTSSIPADEPVNSSYAPLLNKDTLTLPVRAIGDPDAPIQIVEYASLTCGHCANFHKTTMKTLKKKYIDTGKIYMIFKEFPLDANAINASKVLRCMPEDKYYSFMNFLFETQDQWAHSLNPIKKLKQSAKLAGLTDKRVEECLANDELEEAIVNTLKDAAKKHSINSTPSFVVNGGVQVISGGQGIEAFDKVVAKFIPSSE